MIWNNCSATEVIYIYTYIHTSYIQQEADRVPLRTSTVGVLSSQQWTLVKIKVMERNDEL